MNVFDSEMGPVCEQETAGILVTLAMSGCTLAEVVAMLRYGSGNDSGRKVN
jgi:hypothetical protein